MIVVDNASQDGSADLVAEEFPSVRLIRNAKNVGYAAGNNDAFEAAAGDFLLTLNPDTEFEDNTLQRSLELIEAHPQVGCLAVRLVGIDGQTQSSIRGFPTLLGLAGDLLGIRGGVFDSYRQRSFDYDLEQDAPQPMGTFLLFRREALAEIGLPRPFDEGFPIFFNEVDLLARMQAGGRWRCRYFPSLHIKHHGGMSTRQVRKNMIWESHRSLVRYLRKHTSKGWRQLGLLPFAAMIYGAAWVRARGYHAGFRP